LSFNENIANSNLATASKNYELALDYAKKAIKEQPDSPDGYVSAGRACMSKNTLSDAVTYFTKATEKDPKIGDNFFLLGYAQAMKGDTTDSLRSFTRAIERNCKPDIRGQIYKIMGMINIERRDHANALINFKQAEEQSGIDYEVLQHKAVCYAFLKEYKNALFSINQMKLVQPHNYKAYSLAFHLFMELGIYDEAKAELERAKKYAKPEFAYYFDRVLFTSRSTDPSETDDEVRARCRDSVKAINNALLKGEPDGINAADLYLRAAQMYVTLEQYNDALRVLDALADVVSSFNNGFSVLPSDAAEDISSDSGEILSPEEQEAILQEKWDNGEFDDLRDEITAALDENGSDDPEELAAAIHDSLSPLGSVPAMEKTGSAYKLSGDFKMNQVQKDLRNSLYLGIYEVNGEYENMLIKAKELQSSSIVPNQYAGIYYELKAGKYLNKENWEKKYQERISFWTKRMLEDPKDAVSASYRIRSYIDIGDFERAEQLCSCLPADAKKPLAEEISKAKEQGGV